MTVATPGQAQPAFVEVAVAERELPAGVDPLTLLDGASRDVSFAFDQPTTGLHMAMLGRVRDADGELRGPEESSLVRVGGFAFDSERRPSGLWLGFPATSWFVPRVSVVRTPSGAHARVAVRMDEGGLARAEIELDEIVRRLERRGRTSLPTAPPRYSSWALSSAEEWRCGVETILDRIAEGPLRKAVLARASRVVSNRPWHPPDVVRRLRSANPDSTTFLVQHAGKAFVGSTPERLARLEGDQVHTAAIAGTAPPAPVGGDEDRSFLADAKERLEHALVVEEICRRLDSIATDVFVPEGPSILSTTTLRHLHTPISARLAAGAGLEDVCRCLHPTPATCGLPVDDARPLVRSLESFDRGWYAGGIGYWNGEVGEVVVPLRAALLDEAEATLFAGAGIVEGSVWERELEETRLKMRVMQAALLEL